MSGRAIVDTATVLRDRAVTRVLEARDRHAAAALALAEAADLNLPIGAELVEFRAAKAERRTAEHELKVLYRADLDRQFPRRR